MNIKIIGSGSAGNHMAFAMKNIAKKITMTDISKNALKRSKKNIYLKRYKDWDKKITQIVENKDIRKNSTYDFIIISSPPKTHYRSLLKNINKSNFFLIEKPVCEPNLQTIKKMEFLTKKYPKKKFLCGYNHRLFPSTKKLISLIRKHKNQFDFLEVSFKENTDGFMKAHNWYSDLSQSYLSKTSDGGGALSEHSHALNLAQLIVNEKKSFKVINKNIKFNIIKKRKYDSVAEILIRHDKKIIKINQNFETKPVEKNIKVKGKTFYIELTYNHNKNNDKLIYFNGKSKKNYYFKKKRSDDFKYEALFIKKIFNKKRDDTLDISNGLTTMNLVAKFLNAN